jgi:hypothetical protein
MRGDVDPVAAMHAPSQTARRLPIRIPTPAMNSAVETDQPFPLRDAGVSLVQAVRLARLMQGRQPLRRAGSTLGPLGWQPTSRSGDQGAVRT